MEDIDEKVRAIRREYYANYRKTHRTQINKKMAEWRKKNKDRLIQYEREYWLKKLEDKNKGE